MTLPADILTEGLKEFAKVQVKPGSATAQANGKAKVREARTVLEAAPPTPPSPPPVVETRPWLAPIKTSHVLGAVGQTTTIPAGSIIEYAELLGQFIIEAGAPVYFNDVRRVKAMGLGDGATGVRVPSGAHLITNRFEATGSDGRSGVYITGTGTWTPIDTWVHGNGVGRGPMFQQVYVAGGQIIGGQRVKVEDGDDNAIQLYSPSDYDAPVKMVQIDDLEVCGCPNNAGLMVSHRVEQLAITNLKAHHNGHGVRSYNIENGELSQAQAAALRKISDSHIWSNKVNITGAADFTLTNVAETAV